MHSRSYVSFGTTQLTLQRASKMRQFMGYRVLEPIMPQEVQSAALDQILAGKTHNLPDLIPMTRAVAVNVAVLAARPLLQWAAEPAFEGIFQEFVAFRADRVF